MSLDKAALYGTYEESVKRASKLKEEATRKHLDLPCWDDDVNIHNQNGIAGRHIVAIAGMLMAAAMMWQALSPDNHQAIQPKPQIRQLPLEPQEYDVEFWFDDGTKIEVKEK